MPRNVKPQQSPNNLKPMMLLGLLVVSGWVFAIDGIFGVKAARTATFSTFKKDLNLSLRSGFTFQGNKAMDRTSSSSKVVLNGFVTLQKGNVYYHIPNNHKVILSKFKTPSAPVIR